MMVNVAVLLACGVILKLSFLLMARVRGVRVFEVYPRAADSLLDGLHKQPRPVRTQ